MAFHNRKVSFSYLLGNPSRTVTPPFSCAPMGLFDHTVQVFCSLFCSFDTVVARVELGIHGDQVKCTCKDDRTNDSEKDNDVVRGSSGDEAW